MVNALPPFTGHFGQIMLIQELLTGPNFAPLFVPEPRPSGQFDRMLKSRRAAGENTRAMEALLELPRRARTPFGTHKTAAVRRSRSLFTSQRPQSDAETLRVSALDEEGREQAVAWVDVASCQMRTS